jgi:hypothetical protein
MLVGKKRKNHNLTHQNLNLNLTCQTYNIRSLMLHVCLFLPRISFSVSIQDPLEMYVTTKTGLNPARYLSPKHTILLCSEWPPNLTGPKYRSR